MFSVPRVNVIASDEGFSVEVLGRTGLRYSRGDRSLRVDSEVVQAPGGIVVYAGSIQAWEGASGQPIGEAERDGIIEDIRRAFASQGHVVDVF